MESSLTQDGHHLLCVLLHYRDQKGENYISLTPLPEGVHFRHIVIVQTLSCVQLFATAWTAACQASLNFSVSWGLLKFMSIESMMPSNHLILCHPLLLPSVFPSIRVFSNESTYIYTCVCVCVYTEQDQGALLGSKHLPFLGPYWFGHNSTWHFIILWSLYLLMFFSFKVIPS